MDEMNIYKNSFWNVFNKLKLNSKKYKDVWPDLDSINDWLAGPLYSIYEHGNCDYVYEKNDGRFPEVNNPDDFLQWSLNLLQKYKDIIDKIEAQNENEINDRILLYGRVSELERLLTLAYGIQKEWFINK